MRTVPELVQALKSTTNPDKLRLLIKELETQLDKDKALTPPPSPSPLLTLADRILTDPADRTRPSDKGLPSIQLITTNRLKP